MKSDGNKVVVRHYILTYKIAIKQYSDKRCAKETTKFVKKRYFSIMDTFLKLLYLNSNCSKSFYQPRFLTGVAYRGKNTEVSMSFSFVASLITARRYLYLHQC